MNADMALKGNTMARSVRHFKGAWVGDEMLKLTISGIPDRVNEGGFSKENKQEIKKPLNSIVK